MQFLLFLLQDNLTWSFANHTLFVMLPLSQVTPSFAFEEVISGKNIRNIVNNNKKIIWFVFLPKDTKSKESRFYCFQFIFQICLYFFISAEFSYLYLFSNVKLCKFHCLFKVLKISEIIDLKAKSYWMKDRRLKLWRMHNLFNKSHCKKFRKVIKLHKRYAKSNKILWKTCLLLSENEIISEIFFSVATTLFLKGSMHIGGRLSSIVTQIFIIIPAYYWKHLSHFLPPPPFIGTQKILDMSVKAFKPPPPPSP